MPRPGLRNKKVHIRKTPGGSLKFHYEKPKRGKDKCAICKEELRGTYHGRGSFSKSFRRVKRIYGGYLCHRCLEKMIINEVIKTW